MTTAARLDLGFTSEPRRRSGSASYRAFLSFLASFALGRLRRGVGGSLRALLLLWCRRALRAYGAFSLLRAVRDEGILRPSSEALPTSGAGPVDRLPMRHRSCHQLRRPEAPPS